MISFVLMNKTNTVPLQSVLVFLNVLKGCISLRPRLEDMHLSDFLGSLLIIPLATQAAVGIHYETGCLHHSPQEAGESGDGGVHGDAHVSHRKAEHQEITGSPQLPHFEEGDDRHRIQKEAQQPLNGGTHMTR